MFKPGNSLYPLTFPPPVSPKLSITKGHQFLFQSQWFGRSHLTILISTPLVQVLLPYTCLGPSGLFFALALILLIMLEAS